VQALAQLTRAPGIAGNPELERAFAEHLRETEDQERLVREQLEARGAKPSTVKDVMGRVGGWGMILFARVNPGDNAVADMAQRIGAQERAMADRLAAGWDRAVEASLREKSADDIGKELVKYLRDAHAWPRRGPSPPTWPSGRPSAAGRRQLPRRALSIALPCSAPLRLSPWARRKKSASSWSPSRSASCM
jgi:hypothetical protein